MIQLERYVCENELRHGWKRILCFGGRFRRLVANGSRLERNGRNTSGSLEFTCLCFYRRYSLLACLHGSLPMSTQRLRDSLTSNCSN